MAHCYSTRWEIDTILFYFTIKAPINSNKKQRVYVAYLATGRRNAKKPAKSSSRRQPQFASSTETAKNILRYDDTDDDFAYLNTAKMNANVANHEILYRDPPQSSAEIFISAREWGPNCTKFSKFAKKSRVEFLAANCRLY